jgi:hypothetical protein
MMGDSAAVGATPSISEAELLVCDIIAKGSPWQLLASSSVGIGIVETQCHTNCLYRSRPF